MNADNLGDIIEAGIPLLGGLYASLLGFGIVGRKTSDDPAAEARWQRWRRVLRILGPAAILFGVFLAATSEQRHAARQKPALSGNWKRYYTDDERCSAELPEQPEKDVPAEDGTTIHRLLVQQENESVLYLVTWTDLGKDVHADKVDEWLSRARDSLPMLGRQIGTSFELVEETSIVQDGVPGRELKYTKSNNQVIWVRVFLDGSRVYRLLAGAPADTKELEIRHFLDSVRFHGKKK